MNMVPALAQPGWDHMGYGPLSWLWGLLIMIFWIAVIALVVWLVLRALGHRLPPQQQPPDGRQRAREILAERFARGEIDAEEYRERLEHLR